MDILKMINFLAGVLIAVFALTIKAQDQPPVPAAPQPLVVEAVKEESSPSETKKPTEEEKEVLKQTVAIIADSRYIQQSKKIALAQKQSVALGSDFKSKKLEKIKEIEEKTEAALVEAKENLFKLAREHHLSDVRLIAAYTTVRVLHEVGDLDYKKAIEIIHSQFNFCGSRAECSNFIDQIAVVSDTISEVLTDDFVSDLTCSMSGNIESEFYRDLYIFRLRHFKNVSDFMLAGHFNDPEQIGISPKFEAEEFRRVIAAFRQETSPGSFGHRMFNLDFRSYQNLAVLEETEPKLFEGNSYAIIDKTSKLHFTHKIFAKRNFDKIKYEREKLLKVGASAKRFFDSIRRTHFSNLGFITYGLYRSNTESPDAFLHLINRGIKVGITRHDTFNPGGILSVMARVRNKEMALPSRMDWIETATRLAIEMEEQKRLRYYLGPIPFKNIQISMRPEHPLVTSEYDIFSGRYVLDKLALSFIVNEEKSLQLFRDLDYATFMIGEDKEIMSVEKRIEIEKWLAKRFPDFKSFAHQNVIVRAGMKKINEFQEKINHERVVETQKAMREEFVSYANRDSRNFFRLACYGFWVPTMDQLRDENFRYRKIEESVYKAKLDFQLVMPNYIKRSDPIKLTEVCGFIADEIDSSIEKYFLREKFHKDFDQYAGQYLDYPAMIMSSSIVGRFAGPMTSYVKKSLTHKVTDYLVGKATISTGKDVEMYLANRFIARNAPGLAAHTLSTLVGANVFALSQRTFKYIVFGQKHFFDDYIQEFTTGVAIFAAAPFFQQMSAAIAVRKSRRRTEYPLWHGTVSQHKYYRAGSSLNAGRYRRIET